MKLTLTCAALMTVTVVATAAIGYAPTESKWGAEGIDSLISVAAICLGSALVALMPMAFIAPRYPDHIGEAGLATVVIRILLTMGAMVAYQVLVNPHLASFLFWAPIFYLLLLAIETTFGVLFVKRYYRTTPHNDGAAS